MSTFTLRVTSWENDADHYETNRLTGLTRDDADFYYEVASLFSRSVNSRPNPGMGNDEHSIQVLLGAIAPIVNKYIDRLSPEQKEMWEQYGGDVESEDFNWDDVDEDYLLEILHSFLGFPVDYGYEFCRVAEIIVIEQITEGSVGWVRENPEKAAALIAQLREQLESAS